VRWTCSLLYEPLYSPQYYLALDAYPIAFRKDLLQHDAHRHPYLERLAALYMMKLRYGNAFGKRANSCWRLLVVLCLMPWMRKYRLRTASIEEWEKELETEKEKSTENTRFSALKRLKGTRHLGHMEGVTSREDLLEREVAILRERNQKLMEEITNLRERSVDSEVFHDAVESLNGDLYLNETKGTMRPNVSFRNRLSAGTVGTNKEAIKMIGN
jgi:hypothetical protein